MTTRDIGGANRLATGSAQLKYDPAKLHALIITPQDYADQTIHDLRTPIKDGETIERILIDDLGFPRHTVKRLYKDEEVTWKGIDAALRSYLTNPLGEDDSILIYFAGHGKADEVTSEGYWLPADAKPDDRQTWYANDTLNKIIEHYQARHVAVISDSCYSGRLLRELAPRSFSPRLASYYQSVVQSRSRYVLTSGKDHPVSDDGSAGHSIFALRLTDYLKSGPGTLFTLADVFTAIRDRIPDQEVCYGPMKDDAHEHGEMVFCRVSRISNQAPVEPVIEDLKPDEVEVTQYEIEPVTIDIQIVDQEQEHAAPANLPEVPKEYWDLQSRIAGIQEALKKIKQNSHPAFEPARRAVDDAQQQYAKIRNQTEEFCKHKIFQAVKEVVYKHPEKIATDLLDMKPASMGRSDFAQVVVLARKVLEAEHVLHRVEQELKDKSGLEIERLQQVQVDSIGHAETIRDGLLKQVILDFLREHGVLEKPSQLPDEPLMILIPKLAKYPFDFTEDQLWELSEKLLKEHWEQQAGHRKVIQVKGIEYPFRRCLPGSFEMGGPSFNENERPIHEVRFANEFWMLETPVTQEMYKSVMGGLRFLFLGSRKSRFPVEDVSWGDADEFCRRLSKLMGCVSVRLPTEAEWEYAGRAGIKGKYHREIKWYSRKSERKTTSPVGQGEPNAWGLYDMTGLNWEWCQDWYDREYYEKSPVEAPQGPETGSSRVCRGGSGVYGSVGFHTAYRSSLRPEERRYGLGFRIVALAIPDSSQPD